MVKKLGSFVLTILFLGVMASPAMADFFATDWGATSSLYRIDPSTPTVTLIGSTGQTRMIGLVVDTDNTIYAISEEANSRLWTLNPTTGVATLVGSLGFNLQEGDMTINPNTGQMYVADGIGDKLYIQSIKPLELPPLSAPSEPSGVMCQASSSSIAHCMG